MMKKNFINIGLLRKPKIIVCNVDEESLVKGNKYTHKSKRSIPITNN